MTLGKYPFSGPASALCEVNSKTPARVSSEGNQASKNEVILSEIAQQESKD